MTPLPFSGEYYLILLKRLPANYAGFRSAQQFNFPRLAGQVIRLVLQRPNLDSPFVVNEVSIQLPCFAGHVVRLVLQLQCRTKSDG